MRIRDMGRLLMATEIRSMLTYWHVQAPETVGVTRVYPGECEDDERDVPIIFWESIFFTLCACGLS